MFVKFPKLNIIFFNFRKNILKNLFFKFFSFIENLLTNSENYLKFVKEKCFNKIFVTQ